MANKNRKIFGFFAEKISFAKKKCILTYPMQLGVLGRTSVELITPGPSQRDRLLGAVAQWQLRLCVFFQTTILTLIGPLFRNNPETT